MSGAFASQEGAQNAATRFSRVIDPVNEVRDAVLAERERCAKIADGCACQDALGRDECGCGWIADKIRNPA